MTRKKKETQRREKNFGSVFKGADGRWRAMINLGRDENGKRIRKQVYYGFSEEEANEAIRKATEQKSQLDNEIFTKKFSGLMMQWLLNEKQNTVTPRSFDNLMINFKNHIEPKLKNVEMHEIDVKTLKNLLKSIKSEEVRRKTKYLLNQFLNYAVEEKLIAYNPVMSIDIKTRDTEDAIEKEKIEEKRNKYKALSPAVRKKFFDALPSHPFLNYLCHVAYFSGLRIGELLGLRWQDIDMKNKVLSVEHAITTKPEFDKLGNKLSKKTILSNPKTASSKTKLPMSNILVETLKEWKNIQRTKGRKLKMYLTGQKDFVFCNDDGTMRTYYGTRTILNRFLRNNDLDKYGIHFHAIRHTFGDVLREKNWSIYKIQKMLRHSKVTTTQIYLSMDENPALDLKNDIDEVFDEPEEEPENKPKRRNKDFEM